MFVFGNFVDALSHRFRPYSLEVPGAIIVDDSGDL